MKRLRDEMDYLTCGHLDDLQDRAFIGTSGGDIFVLDISKNPPSFLHTLAMNGKPVSMIAASMDSIFVAHADCVTTLSLEPKGSDEKIKKRNVYKSQHLSEDEALILSVVVAAERGWIFGGFSDGSVAMWSGQTEEALIVLGAHQCDVTQLAWLPCEPWGPALFTGGGDGKVTTWLMNGEAEEYAVWSQQELFSGDPSDPFSIPMAGPSASLPMAPAVIGNPAAAAAGSDDPFAPNFATVGGGTPGFNQPGPRINPHTIKSADDSDSDNEIVSAFR